MFTKYKRVPYYIIWSPGQMWQKGPGFGATSAQLPWKCLWMVICYDTFVNVLQSRLHSIRTCFTVLQFWSNWIPDPCWVSSYWARCRKMHHTLIITSNVRGSLAAGRHGFSRRSSLQKCTNPPLAKLSLSVCMCVSIRYMHIGVRVKSCAFVFACYSAFF